MISTEIDRYASWRTTNQEGMRIVYQHMMWHEQLGYNMHPSIKLSGSSPVNVADIGTGHGLWALQMAEKLDRDGVDAHIEAADISLDQCLPESLLPTNVTLRKWNFFHPVPEKWLGKFDLVHVRLVIQAFNNNEDPKAVLRKFVSMLKPGGYLQWGEYDYSSSVFSYTTSPTVPNPAVTHSFAWQFYQIVLNAFNWPLSFYDKLDEEFAVLGLADVVSEKNGRKSPSAAKCFHENLVVWSGQMIDVFRRMNPSKVEELNDLLDKYLDAAKMDGVLSSPTLKIVIGQKPL